MQKEIKQDKYRPARTFRMDYRADMRKMNRALYAPEKEPQSRKKTTLVPKKDLPKIDIAAVGSAAYHRHLKSKNSETFITSLYETRGPGLALLPGLAMFCR